MPESITWWQAYADRNRLLVELGYPSYKAYLCSTLWNSIRSQVIAQARRECWVCGFTAKNVHHRSYSRAALLGDDEADLVALCKECHNCIEYSERLKVGLMEANERLDKRKADLLERRRIVLTNRQFVVKVPSNQPSEQRPRRPSKQKRRRIKQRQEFNEYQAVRKRMMEHKASIKATIND